MEKKKKAAALPEDPDQNLQQEVTSTLKEEIETQTPEIPGENIPEVLAETNGENDSNADIQDIKTDEPLTGIEAEPYKEALDEPLVEIQEDTEHPEMEVNEVTVVPEIQVDSTDEIIEVQEPEIKEDPVAVEVTDIEPEIKEDPVAGEVTDIEPEIKEDPEVIEVTDIEAETDKVEEPTVETTAEETPATTDDVIAETEVVTDTEEAVKEDEPLLELTPVIAEIPEAEEIHKIEEEEEVEVDAGGAVASEDLLTFTRLQLVEKLEQLVHEEDINTVKSQVALIKVAFLKKSKEERQQHLEAYLSAGGNRDEYVPEEDVTDAKFQEVFNIYKTRKQKLEEEFELLKQKNLVEKKKILDELRVLISSEETLKKTYDEFRALQETWNHIGMVPKPDATELWQNYHFLVEKFFDKVKINKELKDLDLKKNLEAKIAICEKAEALLLETSILKSFKQLQQYHEEWKEIGPVNQDKKDEIWNRFKDATDKINERRREYYSQIKEEQENNLMAKNALVDQAEKIVSQETVTNKQWQDSTDQLNELQKIWRTIGPAPKFNNDEVWLKFKSLIDSYFTTKKEFFNDIKEEQVHNYNMKLDLCVQAESLKDNTDWKKTTQELIHLQEEWKKIGPVPRKYSDKVWRRFRTACDEFFKNKSNYFSNIQAHEAENLRKKEELIQKVAAYEFTEDKKQNLEIINGFQREWMDIGFVPIKEKERLQAEFRKTINEQLDKLKISATEMSTMAFKNRYENILKESPDAIRIIAREKTTLVQQITKIQEEINLWENNIGFLAESKKANLLKEEFEKKINKAKEEMKLMEMKLKLLRQS